jgi:hypothetical protein
LSFLDAYSGYHQFSLAIDDEEKTVFITLFGIFYYTKRAFRLKNAGATYQKCVHTGLELKLLGYMVSSWGIDTNPKKVEAIEKLQPIYIQVGRTWFAIL